MLDWERERTNIDGEFSCLDRPKANEEGEAKEGGEGSSAAHAIRIAKEKQHRRQMKLTTLLRLVTMTPAELMSFIALGYGEGLLQMFGKNQKLRDDLSASVKLSHSLLSHFAKYAQVDSVVAAKSSCGYPADITKTMSVDQMLTLYNAVILLYEYSVKFTAFSFIHDENQLRVESAAHLLMVLYQHELAADYNTSDRTSLRKWFAKYSRIARMVEGVEPFSDGEVKKAGEIVEQIGRCQDRLRDTRQELLDITQNYSALIVTVPPIPNGIPESVEPAFFKLTDGVALYRTTAGHANGFDKLNPAAMRRPGKQLQELATKTDDFVAARVAYEAYFAAEMKNTDCDNYLTNSQQFKKYQELVRSHVHSTALMPRVQYAGVPVADQTHLEQIVTGEVYRDQLDMPLVIPVSNPTMPLSHSLTLWIEEVLRGTENMALTAPEGALIFLLCLISNLTSPDGDNRICWIHGLGGVGKTRILKLISKTFFAETAPVTTSMTAGVTQAPMSKVTRFSAVDELAHMADAEVFENADAIFMARGNGRHISNNVNVPPLRSSTSATVSRAALTRTDESKMYSETGRVARVLTWQFVTSNNNPRKIEYPLGSRMIAMPFPSGAVELEALAFADNSSNSDNHQRRAFNESIRRVFAVSTAINHFEKCGLISNHVSLYSRTIALRTIECMVENGNSLTEIMFFTEVKQHGSGDAKDAPARADVQNAAMKKNTAELARSIAELSLGGHMADDDEALVVRFQACRLEISKLFDGMRNNIKRPVFCLKGGEPIMNARVATGIFETVARLNRLDAILAALSCNGLGVSYSTTDAFAQVVARVDELFVYKPEHVAMAIRFMVGELSSVVPDAFVVLGALLVKLLDEEASKGNTPTPAGSYYVFPKFFVRKVKAIRRNAATKKRANGNQFASNRNDRGRPGANGRDRSDDEATIEDAPAEEEIEENIPVKSRVNHFQQKLSEAAPASAWGAETILYELAMSTTWGTVTPDGKQVIPFLGYEGFIELNNTSLCISRHIGDVMNAAVLAFNDVICSSSKSCSFLTGHSTFVDGTRALEGATLASREHNTQDEKGEPLPEPWNTSTLTLDNAFDPIKYTDGEDKENDQVAERTGSGGRSDSVGIGADRLHNGANEVLDGTGDVEMYMAHGSVGNQRSRSNQEYRMNLDLRPDASNLDNSGMLRADSLNGLTAQLSNGMTGIGPNELRATSLRDLHRSHSADFRGFDPNTRGVANSSSVVANVREDDEIEEVELDFNAPPIPRAKKPFFKLISHSSLTEREEREEAKAQAERSNRQSSNGTNNHATSSSSSGPRGTGLNRVVNGSSNNHATSSSSSNGRVDRSRFANAVFASDGKSAFSNLRPSRSEWERENDLSDEESRRPTVLQQIEALNDDVLRCQQDPNNGVFAALMKLLNDPSTARGLIESRGRGKYAVKKVTRKLKEKDRSALDLMVRYLEFKDFAPPVADEMLLKWRSRFLEMQTEKENQVKEAVDAAIQQDMKFDQTVEIYPASRVVLAARSDTNGTGAGSIDFTDFEELVKPYPSKLPALFGKYGKFKSLLATCVSEAGSNSLYEGHRFTQFPLMTLDLVGLLEARKLQRRYGDGLYKYFPGYMPCMQEIQTHRHRIQALVKQLVPLSAFNVARVDSEGRMYLAQSELMSIHEVQEKVREHHNRFLPIPLTTLKPAKPDSKAESLLRAALVTTEPFESRLYADQIVSNVVQMLLLLFKYMRFTCTLHGLIEPAVDYSFVLRTAHSLGIVWFREGVRIVANHTVSTEENTETLTTKVTAELRKYANSVIHSTEESSRSALVEIYKYDPSQQARLKTCLKSMSIPNRRLAKSMYIPLPGDIPLTKEELALEIGLSSSVTKLIGIGKTADLFVVPLAAFDRNRLAGINVSCDRAQRDFAFEDYDDEEQKAPRAGNRRGRGGRGGRDRGRGHNDNEPNDGRSLGSRDTGESDEDSRNDDRSSHYSRASRRSRRSRHRSARSRSRSRPVPSQGALDRHARNASHHSRRESYSPGSRSSRSRSPSNDESTRDLLQQLAVPTPAASQLPSQAERRDDVNMEMSALVHPIENSQRRSESKRAIENSQGRSESKRADDQSERHGRHRHDDHQHSQIRTVSAHSVSVLRGRLKKYIREWTESTAKQKAKKYRAIQKLQQKLREDMIIGQDWLDWERGMACPDECPSAVSSAAIPFKINSYYE